MPFAEIARTSREYQGHGWGCAWYEAGSWSTYHNISPVWEDDLDRFGQATVLLAHARSAFRDEGIVVENNMPFVENEAAFVFNGELRGVRIAEAGRIGAEKLFRFLLRNGARESPDRAGQALRLVHQRTRYVRAMNFVIGCDGRFLVASSFSEDEDYFTVHLRRRPGEVVVSSAPYEAETGWAPVRNGGLEEIPWLS